MATKRDAHKAAERHGCTLFAEYAGKAEGWVLILDAPDGKVFKHNGCTMDADINGNGMLKGYIDWQNVINSIEEAVAGGFEENEE